MNRTSRRPWIVAWLLLSMPIVLRHGSATVESGTGLIAGGGPASGQEAFKTDLLTGGARASVPLLVPPGTAGFHPKIALTYASQRGRGWIGRGWDLELRRIRRVTKRGIPSYSDDPGDPRPDRFLLDDEPLVRDREDVFHTARESFQRIEPYRDPTTGAIRHWVVHRPDGSTLWFGSEPASHSRIVDRTSGRPLTWWVDRAQDRNGNFIRYRYQTPQGSEGIVYPAEIAYGFRGDGGERPGGAWPSSDTLRRILFQLEPRPDVAISHRGGVRTVLAHRLDSIGVRVGRSLVTAYDLVYLDETESGAPGAHANGGSLLHRVVRLGSDGLRTLPSDAYGYSGSVPTWEANPKGRLLEARLGELLGGSGFNLTTGNWRILDVNGDAAVDFVFTGASESLAADDPPLDNQRVYINHKFVSPDPSGSLPVNPFFDHRSTRRTPIYHVPLVWDPDRNPLEPRRNGALHVSRADSRWVDYDGDGRVDLVWGFSDETVGGNGAVLDLWRNDGIHWETEPEESEWWRTLPRPPTVYFSQCAPMKARSLAWGTSIFADVNGDGLPELLFSAVSGAGGCDAPLERSRWDRQEVFLNRGPGTGWEPAPDPGWSAALAQALELLDAFLHQVVPFDLNGDGLVDLSVDADGDGRLDGPVLVHTGRGWVDATSVGIQVPPGLRPADLDGDGLVDHAGTPPLLNQGNRFRSDPSLRLPAPFDDPERVQALVDLDGDGLVDLIRAEKPDPEGPSHHLVLLSGGETDVLPEGLLVRIDRATGGVVELYYGVTTRGSCIDSRPDDGCHARFALWSVQDQILPGGLECTLPMFLSADGERCLYPVELLPFPVFTVQGVSVDDANGNRRIDVSEYQGGFYDAAGREFRGFGIVTETPQSEIYPHPSLSSLDVFNQLKRRTFFYRAEFLRGAWGKVEVSRVPFPGAPEEELLERDVNHYALTRGDLAGTAWLRAFDFGIACDDFDGDVDALPDDREAPGDDAVGGCELFNLESSTYRELIDAIQGDEAPLPYASFRERFDPAGREARLAYLVLPVGRVRYLYDGHDAPVVLLSARWHDPWGNVQLHYDFGQAGVQGDDRVEVRRFASSGCATDPGAPIECGPKHLTSALSTLVQQSASGVPLARRLVLYDGLFHGEVARGNATSEISGLGADVAHVVRTFAPDTFGLPDAESDPFAPGETPAVTRLSYDPSATFVTRRERMIAAPGTEALAATGLVSTTSYDPAGAPPGMGIAHLTMDANGAVVTRSADPFGRTTSTSGPLPLGETERHAYDDFVGFDPDRPRETATVRDGNGNDATVRLFADGLGRTIRVERDALDPNERRSMLVQETHYDPLGRIGLVTRPYVAGDSPPGGTSTLYDVRGRVRFVLQPDGGVREFLHQRLRSRTIDAAGRQTDRILDGQGRVVELRERPGSEKERVTTYRYDPLGRLRAICNAESPSCPEVECDPSRGECTVTNEDPRYTTVIDYDALGRRTRLHDPDRGEWVFVHDGGGRLLLRRDARGSTVAYGYDDLGRRVSESTGEGATIFYTYGDRTSPPRPNGLGRLVGVAGPEGEFAYAYDRAGRTRELTWRPGDGSAYTLSSSHDWLDRVTSTTYPDGEKVFRRYDLMGLDAIFSNRRAYVNDVRHDSDGRPTRIKYANGVQREMAYEAETGRLRELRDDVAGPAGPLLHRRLVYDLLGRVAAVYDLVDGELGVGSVEYDALGRTTAAMVGNSRLTYRYDPLGNLTEKEGVSLTYEHPARPHALFDARAPWRYVYDANGNPLWHDGLRLHHDGWNRLVRIETDPPTRFGYDHAGERVRAERGAVVSRFLSPDLEIIHVREPDGRLSARRRFVKTLRLDGTPVVRVSSSDSVAAAAPEPLGGGGIRRVAAGLGLLALTSLLSLPGVRRLRRRIERVLGGASVIALCIGGTRSVGAAIPDGDLNADGRLDAADVLLMQRIAAGDLAGDAELLSRADVAPLGEGGAGTPEVDSGDLVILLRALTEGDLDGDGVSTEAELAAGGSPFRRDTDRDGLDDSTEIAFGTRLAHADSDGDGIPDAQDPDPLRAAAEEVLWIHTDPLGSVVALSDARGALVRKIFYGVWGEVRSNVLVGAARASDPAEKFTGQRYDEETGLYYHGARYYDPGIGRFLQADPLFQGSPDPPNLNPYAYAANDPLNRVDPTGYLSIPFLAGGSPLDFTFRDFTLYGGTYLYDSFGQGGFTGFVYSYHRDAEGRRRLQGEVYAFGRTPTFSPPSFFNIETGRAHGLAEAASLLRALPIEQRNLYTQGIWGSELQVSSSAGGDPSFLERAEGLVGTGVFIFNPTDGRLNDLVESFMQKFFPGAARLDRLAAELVRRAGGVNLARGFSQGSLTIRNAALLLGLTGGRGMIRKAQLVGSPSNFLTAWLMTEAIGGGELDFRASGLDLISAIGHPELAPAALLGTALCAGFRCYHDDMLYGR